MCSLNKDLDTKVHSCTVLRNNQTEASKLIKIYLQGRDLGTAIVNILKACDLPTSHVQHYAQAQQSHQFDSENIQFNGDEWIRVKYKNEFDFTKLDKNHPLYATFGLRQRMQEAKENLR